MPKTKTDKRSWLIQTAVKLAYRHGFRTTSLADIAEAAKVPVGNVYYYFKTKDEIGEAIVATFIGVSDAAGTVEPEGLSEGTPSGLY
jgi:AcrR family transcriptional regulator